MIELVSRDDILSLRHTVLRPEQPLDNVRYPEDAHPEVFHLADRTEDGTLIACVTFFPEEVDDRPAWRFRGMATRAEHRNAGVGGRLLEAGCHEVARRDGSLVWCNGRVAAAAFYERHGFVARGEEFGIPPANLPHLVFVRTLAEHPQADQSAATGGRSRANAAAS